MKHMAFVMSLLLSAIAMADRPILLITPKGVYEAEVTNGVPGPWKAAPYDVIVQGFGGGGGTTPVPPGDPPTTGDSQLVSIAKEVLKDKTEATFAAAVIDSLMKAGLKDADLKDALKLTAPIADSAANAEGRIVKFFNQILEVSTDGKAIQAAIVSAFSIAASTLDTIRAAAASSDPPTGSALDFQAIILMIQGILQLLRNLGII
jgi:hypothetical protein